MILKHIIMTVLLLSLSQLSRFQNVIQLDFSPGSAEMTVHNNHYSIALGESKVISVSAILQKSMLEESYVTGAKIETDAGLISDNINNCFYLFGRCFGGDAIKGSYPNYQYTYGDWTMDRFHSNPVSLYENILPGKFRVTVSFSGRGDKAVKFLLADGKYITANLSDGYLDNASSLCINEDCGQNSFNDESTKTNIFRIFNFFVEAFLAGYLLYWLVFILKLFQNSKKIETRALNIPHRSLITLLFILHFFICSYYSRNILGSTPHVSDSAIYYRQAVLISHLMTKTSPLPAKPYEAFLSNSSYLDGNQIVYKHANRFWPAMLAPFMKLGIPDLLNPLLSALTLILIYLFSSFTLYRDTGLLAAAIYAFSPFAVINAGDYMMHVASMFLFLGGLTALIYAIKSKQPVFSMLAGILIAYAFGIRQLSILALLLPALILVASLKLEYKFRDILLFLTGSGLIAIIFILDNYFLTGEWFVLAHKKFHNLSASLSNLQAGANWTDANLGSLPQILYGSFIPQITLGFITLPLLLKGNLKLWLIFLSLPALVCAHLLVPVHGLHGYGPRFLFESIFAMSILAACGILFVLEESAIITKFIFIPLCALYFLQNIYLAKEILPKYSSYNGVFGKRIEDLRASAVPKTIYVMQGSYWQTLDQAVSLFDPTFKEYMFIQQQSPGYEKIIQAFPDWKTVEVSFVGQVIKDK